MRLRHVMVTVTLASALAGGLVASPAPAADRSIASNASAVAYSAASDRSACVNQVGTRTYRPSSDVQTLKNPDVYLRHAQVLLSSHLGAPGPGFVEGIFGPTTRTCVRMFQRNGGLSVDGVVGPDTWYWLITIN